MEEPTYISVREAATRAGYSVRHFHRFLERGEIASVRENPSCVKVEVESLNAFLEQRGARAIDPLERMKMQVEMAQRQLAAQEQVNGRLGLEIAEVRTMIAAWATRVEALGAQVRALSEFYSHGVGAPTPDGTMMLVDFAERHAVSVSKLRTLVTHDPTLATIIDRPNAIRQRHKWLIGIDQQARMIAAIAAHGIAYSPCEQCPHSTAKDLLLAQ